jgi:hypothetical protein
MLFLLNDVVYRLDGSSTADTGGFGGRKIQTIRDLEFIIQEMFSAEPSLAQTSPEKAMQVIDLLVTKFPDLNAAWFRPPALDCDPRFVRIRYANVSIEVLAGLYSRQERGALTTAIVDHFVWQRVPMRKLATRA